MSSTKPRILQQGSHPAYEALLVQEFDVHPLYKETDPKAFLAQHGAEFVGLATPRSGAPTRR